MMHDTHLAGTLLRLVLDNVSYTLLQSGSDDATGPRGLVKQQDGAYFDFLPSGLLFSLTPFLVIVVLIHHMQSYPPYYTKRSDDAGQLSFMPRSRSYAGLAALPSLVLRR